MIVKTQIKCGSTPSQDLRNRIIDVTNDHVGSLGCVCKLRVSRTSNWITVYINVPDYFRKHHQMIENHKIFISHFISGILAWEGEDLR